MNTYPAGFTVINDFLSDRAEAYHISLMRRLPFGVVHVRGNTLRRRVLAYGAGLTRNFQQLCGAPAIPAAYRRLLRRAATAANLPNTTFDQMLLQWYPPGARIGWHVDLDLFDTPILGISLQTDACLNFRKRYIPKHVVGVPVPRRSLYVMDKASRYDWEHAITPSQHERFSITFRRIATVAHEGT